MYHSAHSTWTSYNKHAEKAGVQRSGSLSSPPHRSSWRITTWHPSLVLCHSHSSSFRRKGPTKSRVRGVYRCSRRGWRGCQAAPRSSSLTPRLHLAPERRMSWSSTLEEPSAWCVVTVSNVTVNLTSIFKSYTLWELQYVSTVASVLLSRCWDHPNLIHTGCKPLSSLF